MSGRRVDVGAVIVSYGPAARALACARSLRAGSAVPSRVLVVNNDPGESFDGPDGVTVVQPGTNLGYGGALRLGVDLLGRTEAMPAYLWFLNNDVVVHPDALQTLIDAAERDPDTGLWGSTICLDESFDVVAAVGVRYSSWTTRRNRVLAGADARTAVQRTSEVAFDFVPGSAMFVPTAAYRRCGGLSDEYFMYFEELDLAARMRGAGLGIGWCPTSLVAHVGGATTGSYLGRRRKSAFVAYHSSRSAVIYTRRHQPTAVPAVVTARLLGDVGLSAVVGNFAAARAAWRGCRDGLAPRSRVGARR